MSNTLKYPHLFEPIVLGGVFFRNRIFAAPQGYYNVGPERFPNRECIAYFARKAQGGFASTCIGDCIVDEKTGTFAPVTMRIDDPNSMAGFAAYASAISRRGAVPSVELSHAGIHAMAVAANGDPVYGPVAMDGMYGHVEEMPEEVIEHIIERYANAAAFAKSAGCKMATLHGGHGWMLAQFWNKNVNTRKDKWGGEPIENRMRLSIEVCKAIRKAVGPNFAIEFRMSGSECCDGGYDIDEGVEFAKHLDGIVDLINVSAGHHQDIDASVITHPSMFLEDGCNSKYAREIKKHVETPVSTVGAFTDPAMMEEFIASGGADVIELGRQSLADPDLPNKARAGRDEDINKCMRCTSCFTYGGRTRKFQCAIRPQTSHELEYADMPPVQKTQKVLIAGGGVGGMQVAITAAKRGHQVILCEKTDRLGGVLLCEDQVPFKKRLGEYLARQARYCAEAGVDIRLNTEVTPEYVAAEQPDVVVAAMGSSAVKPQIPGIDGANVFAAEDVYADVSKAGDNVVIIGAGLVGIELAIYLDGLGKKATLVEVMDKPTMVPSMHSLALDKEIRLRQLPLRLSTKATQIRDDGVEVEGPDGADFLPADTVVYAVGRKAHRDAAMALSECAPQFVIIGDCDLPQNIIEATQPAETAAMFIGTC